MLVFRPIAGLSRYDCVCVVFGDFWVMVRSKLFIETIFPVQLLNEQVNYEHGGNPFKGLHRWYSRKPLSFSRASVLASLLPGSVTMEEFEELLGLERRELRGDRKNAVKLYKTPPGEGLIDRVQSYCEGVWGDRTPAVLDAFAGGGSIPFEAARYGLRVFGSDLNPVAVVTMKAAIEFPLRFGAGLQGDIDRWVRWVGDEAAVRLGEFFPSGEGETVQNYLWAHTVVCPSCGSVVPLSPNWWLSKTSNYAGKGQARKVTSDWYAVKPVPNLKEKRVDFELIKGKKGKGATIQTPEGDFDPNDFATISRGVGKCCNCENVIENSVIMQAASRKELDCQVYAVAFKKGKSSLDFRLPKNLDLSGIEKSKEKIKNIRNEPEKSILIPDTLIPEGKDLDEQIRTFCPSWSDMFNPRQLLTLVTYVEIINEAKEKIREEFGEEKAQAIVTYLALVLDRCVDRNCRLSIWHTARSSVERASTQHALNLTWNYPEISGNQELWKGCADPVSNEYQGVCNFLGTKTNSSNIQEVENYTEKNVQIDSASADSLFHLADQSIDSIVTDPPYYGTIQYAELSDFFYVWQKRILGDIFPELYTTELTDKNREAVANPSRFRNMGASPADLAAQDYEAKMQLAFSEYHRVLKDHGVMTVQFNHKESGAWDILTKSLIDAGFEITASWAVNTENPQNLHQAKKNSVSSTVLLVCRKRDPNAPQAWWDDLRSEVNNTLTAKTIRRGAGQLPQSGIPANPEEIEHNDQLLSRLEWLEEYGINGIDLYLSAFGPALNVFSKSYPILDSSGETVRPEQAFEETRRAVANYRLAKLLHGKDTNGIDPLTQWYLLAWDAFQAREFPFDEARQLALAIGGFNVTDLSKTHKLLDSTSGTCKLLEPRQRSKKRAFSVNPDEFNPTALIDGIHAAILIYDEEGTIAPVRTFLQNTNLITNDRFLKTWEIALQVLPSKTSEHDSLQTLWLSMDEIKANVSYEQLTIGNTTDPISNTDPAQLGLSLEPGLEP
jgi:adenine-specific DNA methylase